MAGAGKSRHKTSGSRSASHKLVASAGKTKAKARKTTMAEPKKPAADADGERNVDQIRDILFGGQMRDYERRFLEMGQRLEAEMTRLRESQDKRLAQVDKRLDEQFEKLSRQLRQEVADRNQAVDDLESRVQQSARTARTEVNNALDGLGGELNAVDERLRGALADLSSALNERASEAAASVSRASGELRAEKVGREDLSALLTELALRLKGDFDLPSN
jgi:DNA anti-recombination protein RmuC